MNEDIIYNLSKKVTVADTIYFFRSFNKFDSVELIHKLNYPWYENIELSGGYNSGVIYMFDFTESKLWISNDFFNSYQSVDTFNLAENYITGIEGGKTEGEFYILYTYFDQFYESQHIYIYQSSDYGKTFEVFHPFAKGDEPVLANFSTIDKELHLTTPVEFTNFSVGDILEYEWDFDNDGTIDSYEQNPIHSYQDTGYYTVKLSITGAGGVIQDYGVRYDYIHVDDLTNTNLVENINKEIHIYPNPVSDQINISIKTNLNRTIDICIYNSQGELVRLLNLKENAKSPISLPVNDLPNGIYFLKMSTPEQSQTKKIIINH